MPVSQNTRQIEALMEQSSRYWVWHGSPDAHLCSFLCVAFLHTLLSSASLPFSKAAARASTELAFTGRPGTACSCSCTA